MIWLILLQTAKVNAFISTIIEIAQHYNLTRESFFGFFAFVSEAHTNYFEDLEQKSYSFSNRFMLIWRFKFLLKNWRYFDRRIWLYDRRIGFSEQDQDLRSIFVPKAKHYYFQGYRRAKKAFILAKEIAYNYLQITERLYTFSWIKFDNFDQVLNNFTLLILQEPCLFLGKINRWTQCFSVKIRSKTARNGRFNE
jgi:hypothetical protein